jgi:hypothetical protein
MIIHTVAFKLKYTRGSSDEKNFLNAARRLASIPGVYNLQSFRQTSKKNNFDFGLSMEFKTLEEYETYNQHRDHLTFIEKFWLEGVENFLEIDYEPLH